MTTVLEADEAACVAVLETLGFEIDAGAVVVVTAVLVIVVF